jgi:hypothetical protein
MKAFPTEHPIAGMMDLKSDGMDLRDYFAAKAMQAMLSWEDCGNFNVSKEAYQMADAMMEARGK